MNLKGEKLLIFETGRSTILLLLGCVVVYLFILGIN